MGGHGQLSRRPILLAAYSRHTEGPAPAAARYLRSSWLVKGGARAIASATPEALLSRRGGLRRVLVELSVVEQRYRAVLEVLAGSSKTAMAERFGVSRQAVHRWLGWYAESGLAGLADRSHRPASHPLQTPASVEAAVCELRRAHPRWGPRRLEYELGVRGCPGPVPSRSTIYRVPLRQGLIDHSPRGRSRASYRRWQRDAPMQLWQLDIVGGVFLTGGAECKVVVGVRPHLWLGVRPDVSFPRRCDHGMGGSGVVRNRSLRR